MLLRRRSPRRSSLKKAPLILAMCLNTSIMQQHVFAGEEKPTDRPGNEYLDFDDPNSDDEGVDDSAIQTERHSLLELLARDGAFIKANPANVMTAAQIILAMIKNEAMGEASVLGYDGKITEYSFFSHDNPTTGGRSIIGQFPGIKSVVDGIEAQARGSKTGVKVPLLVGTHGTGKTEFRTVVANALRHLTKSKTSAFHMHEISWIISELRNIPDVAPYIRICQESEFRSPLHSSPIGLLSEEAQLKVQKSAQPSVDKLIGPNYPMFHMEVDPVSKYIRDHIIMYFLTSDDAYVVDSLAKWGIERSPHMNRFKVLDEVKILDNFVTMRRVILGEPGTVPLIDAQGEDIDYQGLLMSENPVFRMLPGSSSVWAWNYNGAVLSGNRNLIFLDEFFRNEMTLRDTFLGITESRVVSHGGSPSVPIDTVIIAATNSANLDKAKADPKALAQVNRMRIIPFEWATNPAEIAKIILYMNGKGIRMQKLVDHVTTDEEVSVHEEEYEPMNLDLLFPAQEISRPIKTPDGRFKLIFGTQEDDAVFVSPHTLMFLADFIATTRMNTSVKDAKALKGSEQIIGDPKFTDPLARLKVLKGELNVLPSQARELYKLSKRLKEGSFGMSARVAGTWFSESIIEARQPENDRTLTPIILRKVYDRMVDEDAVEIPDTETRIAWKALMDKVAEGILIPKLHNDIYSAFHNDAKIGEIYDSIMLEIVTLAGDEGADVYENREGLMMRIDKTRLEKIRSIYKQQTGRALAVDQIAQFYIKMAARTASSNPPRNDQLLSAINEYLATSLDAFVGISDLLGCAEKNSGSRDVKEKYRSVEHTLVAKLGYNKRSIIDALRVIKQYSEKLND